jgi:hypothetical protein
MKLGRDDRVELLVAIGSSTQQFVVRFGKGTDPLAKPEKRLLHRREGLRQGRRHFRFRDFERQYRVARPARTLDLQFEIAEAGGLPQALLRQQLALARPGRAGLDQAMPACFKGAGSLREPSLGRTKTFPRSKAA